MEQSGTFNGSTAVRINWIRLKIMTMDAGVLQAPKEAQIAPAASSYSVADSAAYTPRLNWNVLSATVTT